jgi:hypothetical protein
MGELPGLQQFAQNLIHLLVHGLAHEPMRIRGSHG